MGRWISRDPLGEGHDRTLYSYCANNPISAVDPDGLEVVVYLNKGKKRRKKFCSDQSAYDFILEHKADVVRIDFIGHGDPDHSTSSTWGHPPSDLTALNGLHRHKNGSIWWQIDDGGQAGGSDGQPRLINFPELVSQLPNLRSCSLRGCNTAGGPSGGDRGRDIADTDGQYPLPAPTDNNIANSLHQAINRPVTGAQGYYWYSGVGLDSWRPHTY
jgi:hypothetical protein